jgi:hypothetical protein
MTRNSRGAVSVSQNPWVLSKFWFFEKRRNFENTIVSKYLSHFGITHSFDIQGAQQKVVTDPSVKFQMPQLLPSNRWDSPYCAAWKRESQRHHISSTSRIIVARSVRVRFFIQRMEYDHMVMIRFLCKEHISPEDIHARLEAQLGDATDSGRSVRRSCQYVRQGREDLHDEAWSSRSSIDFLAIRILALLDEQPFYSAYSIAEALGISSSTILSYLRESFVWKFSFTLDLARVNDQFATYSDGNLPRVIAHSQGSREK